VKRWPFTPGKNAIRRYPKADQPQAIELAAGEVEFGVRELAGRHVTVADAVLARVGDGLGHERRRW
jgi:hypothetical protein